MLLGFFKTDFKYPDPAQYIKLQNFCGGQGGIVHINTVSPVEPSVIIKRKQIVVVKIESPGLTVSSLGEALSDGKAGEYIKVKMGMNRNSRHIIVRVKPDGTVVPVY